MRRSTLSFSVIAAVALTAIAISAQTAPVTSQAALAANTHVQARLASSLDTAHAYVGQSIHATTTATVTTADGVTLPKGTRLDGQVTSVTAAANSHARASLSAVFDHAVVKGHGSVPIRLQIAGVAAARPYAQFDGMAGAGSPMLTGGASGAADAAAASSASAGGSASATGGGGAAGLGGALGATLSGVGSGAANLGGNLGGGVAAGASGATSGVSAGASGATDSAAGAGTAAGATLNGVAQASNGTALQIQMSPVEAGTKDAASAQGSVARGSMLVSSEGNFRLESGSRLELVPVASARADGAASASASGGVHN